MLILPMLGSPIKIVESIGKGGYGIVYRGQREVPIAERGKDAPHDVPRYMDVAVKFIEHSKSKGMESLIEINITQCLRHRFLLHSLEVFLETQGNVRIVFPLAQSDVATMVRKRHFQPAPATIKRWIWQVVCAVAHLHSNGIVHGDIKAGNILIFGPSLPAMPSDVGNAVLNRCNVQLADFGLSVVVPDPHVGTKDMPSSISYTSTHRPAEVWSKSRWSYPADIWALGCTVYEMVYGTLLFQDHRGYRDEAEAMLSCHAEWGARDLHPPMADRGSSGSPRAIHRSAPIPIPGVGHMGIPIPLERSPSTLNPAPDRRPTQPFASSCPVVAASASEFKPCVLSPAWHQRCNRDINDLILSMVCVDSSARATIWDVITHPYFDDVRTEADLPLAENRAFPTLTFLHRDSDEMMEVARKLSDDVNVQGLAVSMFLRSRDQPAPPTAVGGVDGRVPTLRTCILMAHKLLYKVAPFAMGRISAEQREEEVALCRLLGYRLLPYGDIGRVI